jgi:hypothetical protein
MLVILVAREIVAQAKDWSPPVEVKLLDNGDGTVEMQLRTVDMETQS